ncbi:hypothetical protein JCM6882_008063 [Rhodosporidiobolus microsporus]
MKEELTLFSYNIRRSSLIWERLLHSLLTPSSPSPIDIFLLQEPPSHLSLPAPGWTIITPLPSAPADNGETRPRSVIVVSPAFPPSAIRQLPLPTRNVVVVDLQTTPEKSVRVVSVYNPHLSNQHKNPSCRQVLPALLSSSPPDSPLVVAGDFNLRHAEWDPLLLTDPPEEAEEARLTFENGGLVHLKPPGQPTWFGTAGTAPRTIDLALGNLRAENMLVSADVDPSLECGSDHSPIKVVLQTAVRPTSNTPRRLLRKLDEGEATSAYLSALESLPAPSHLTSAAEIDLEAEIVTTALAAALETAPLSKPGRSRFAHGWWTEVAAASAEARRLQNREVRLKMAGRTGEAVAAGVAARRARNRLTTMVRREKRKAERDELEVVTEANLWKVVKSRLGESNCPGGATPPLKKEDGTYAVTTDEKIALLTPVLLPVVRAVEEEGEEEHREVGVSPLNPTAMPFTPSPAPTPPTSPAEEKESVWPILQEEEVKSALFVARPFAAAGPDGVPNRLLQLNHSPPP